MAIDVVGVHPSEPHTFLPLHGADLLLRLEVGAIDPWVLVGDEGVERVW